jgi:hypothetical protein
MLEAQGLRMSDFATVTDADLERARHDPEFRRKLLTASFERLIARLQAMSDAPAEPDSPEARQGREGLDLAVKLANILQRNGDEDDDERAA